eukprot:4493757-Pleurochrysis_carterae.AAC.1
MYNKWHASLHAFHAIRAPFLVARQWRKLQTSCHRPPSKNNRVNQPDHDAALSSYAQSQAQ